MSYPLHFWIVNWKTRDSTPNDIVYIGNIPRIQSALSFLKNGILIQKARTWKVNSTCFEDSGLLERETMSFEGN